MTINIPQGVRFKYKKTPLTRIIYYIGTINVSLRVFTEHCAYLIPYLFIIIIIIVYLFITNGDLALLRELYAHKIYYFFIFNTQLYPIIEKG